MPKVTTAQTNFTAGEFSPKVLGRFDISRYGNGAQLIKNFLIQNAGGGNRRPGSKFVGDVRNSSLATRLIEFVFNTEQTYIIELGNLYMRFYSNNGRVVENDVVISGATAANPVVVTAVGHGYSNGDWVVISEIVGMTELNGRTFKVANKNPNDFQLTDIDDNPINGLAYSAYVSGGVANKVLQVTTTYTTAEIPDIQYTQKADVLYLVHPSHPPATLSRTAANAFTLADITFLGGPFLDDNTTATTITPSADAGAGITLTASASIFNANHVGAFWKVKSGYVKIVGWTSGTVVTADVKPKQDGTAGNLATGPAATTDWAEGAWSVNEGYPSAITFHEQRLVFGATTYSPQSFWGSYIRVFEDFFPGTNDSDSYSYTIATEQVNAIKWFSTGPAGLEIGTFGGEFLASAGNDTVPIAPTNILVSRITSYGSSKIKPRRIGDFVYYVQRNLKTLRELGQSDYIESPRENALDMTLLADHILDSEGDVVGAKEMAYQQSPNNVLWIVRNDGQIATLTRQIDQEVTAWSRQIIGGTFQGGDAVVESIAIIPGLSGDDQIWIIVKRTINSTTRRYVEYLMPQSFVDQDDYFGVDSGLSLDNPITITAATKASPVVVTAASHGFSNGDYVKIVDVKGMTELNNRFFKVKNVAANTFELTDTSDVNIDGTAYTTYITGGEVRKMVLTVTGLGHLEGETVSILADGAVRPAQVVTSGAITLSSRAAKIHIGLLYNSDLKLLPLSDGSPIGTGRSKMRSIYNITILVYRSIGLEIGFEDRLDTIYFRSTAIPQGQPPSLFTGSVEKQYPSNWDKDGAVFIRQSQPLPCNILAIILNSEVQDR